MDATPSFIARAAASAVALLLAAGCASSGLVHDHPKSPISDVAFSPDGERVAYVAHDGSVGVRRWAEPEIAVFEVEGLASGRYDLEWSPDGAYLVAADVKVYVIDANTGDRLATLAERGNSPTFTADGTWLATSSLGRICLWRAPDWKLESRIGDHPAHLAFGPRGDVLASAYGNHIDLYSPADGSLIGKIDGSERTQEAQSVAFSPTGDLIAITCRRPDAIQVFEVATGKLEFEIKGARARGAQGVEFSPDGTLIATGHDDETVRVWSAEDGALVNTITPPELLEGQKARIRRLDFSPDGTRIVFERARQVFVFKVR